MSIDLNDSVHGVQVLIIRCVFIVCPSIRKMATCLESQFRQVKQGEPFKPPSVQCVSLASTKAFLTEQDGNQKIHSHIVLQRRFITISKDAKMIMMDDTSVSVSHIYNMLHAMQGP